MAATGPVGITYIAGYRDADSDPNDPYGGFTVGWAQAGRGFGEVSFSMDGDGRFLVDSEFTGKDFARTVLLALVEEAVLSWREQEPRALMTVGDRLDNLAREVSPPAGASFAWCYRRLDQVAYLGPATAAGVPADDEPSLEAEARARELSRELGCPVVAEGWPIEDGAFVLYPRLAAFDGEGMLP